jgi:hypothetical protein
MGDESDPVTSLYQAVRETGERSHVTRRAHRHHRYPQARLTAMIIHGRTSR